MQSRPVRRGTSVDTNRVGIDEPRFRVPFLSSFLRLPSSSSLVSPPHLSPGFPVDILHQRFKRQSVRVGSIRCAKGATGGLFFIRLFPLDFAGEVYRDICAKSGLGGMELRWSRAQFLDEQYAFLRAGGIHRREGRQHCHAARSHIHVLRGLQLHGHE